MRLEAIPHRDHANSLYRFYLSNFKIDKFILQLSLRIIQYLWQWFKLVLHYEIILLFIIKKSSHQQTYFIVEYLYV